MNESILEQFRAISDPLERSRFYAAHQAEIKQALGWRQVYSRSSDDEAAIPAHTGPVPDYLRREGLQ